MRALHAALALLVLGCVPRSLSAQANENNDVRLESDCRFAGQILGAGRPSPHWDWALSAIRGCDVSGPATIIALWEKGLPSERGELIQVIGIGGAFPVRRVFDAARSVAENPASSTDARILAIGLLASYAEPAIWLSARDLFAPQEGRRPDILSGSGGEVRPGELRGVRPEVVGVLEGIRDRTPDGLVRNAAVQYLYLLNTATTGR